MSVLAKDRTKSQIAYYYDAIQIRKAITKFLLRDFGIKDKIRSVDYEAKMVHMDEEDKEKLKELLSKYDLGNKLRAEFPEWLIDVFRRKIMGDLQALTSDITFAHSMLVLTNSDKEARRLSQEKAIAHCENILQELQYAIDVFDIDVEKFMPYVGLIEAEIENIREWEEQTDNEKIT